jgi:hypothetical protein
MSLFALWLYPLRGASNRVKVCKFLLGSSWIVVAWYLKGNYDRKILKSFHIFKYLLEFGIELEALDLIKTHGEYKLQSHYKNHNKCNTCLVFHI